MIEYQGERYLSVREVAERFHISRGLCYSNILAHVNKCYLPGRKHALYRLSDIEQFSHVRVVENNHCRAFPASTRTTAAETGNVVTSSSNTLELAGIASIANPVSKNNRKEAAYDKL